MISSQNHPPHPPTPNKRTIDHHQTHSSTAHGLDLRQEGSASNAAYEHVRRRDTSSPNWALNTLSRQGSLQSWGSMPAALAAVASKKPAGPHVPLREGEMDAANAYAVRMLL